MLLRTQLFPFALATFCSLVYTSATARGQAERPFLPVTTIDLAEIGCLRVYDFAAGPNSLVVLCRTSGSKLVLFDFDPGGRLLRSTGLPGLDHSSFGLAVSARNQVAVLGRGIPLRHSEVAIISPERIAGPAQRLDQLLFELRFVGEERMIAANGQRVFTILLDTDGRTRLNWVADVNTRYPLLVFDRGGASPQVMDMTSGTFPATGSSPAYGPIPPSQLPEAKDLPQFREDGSVVPMFYTGDVNSRGDLCVLLSGFRHDEGALMVVLGRDGDVRRKVRLGLARHVHAVSTTHPGGHEMPIVLRLGGNAVYTLAVSGTRISAYAIPDL